MLLSQEPFCRRLLKKPPELGEGVEALQSVTPGQSYPKVRVYSCGLHKVERRELAQIPARAC